MPGVSIRSAKRIEVEGWNASTLELYSHCGTHMDAPFHFVPGAATIEAQDLRVCIGPAIVVHLHPIEPKRLIEVADLASIESQVTPGCRLLLRTDWHKRYGTDVYRHGLPRISLNLARWLVEKRVGLIGVEPPSVADVNNIQEVTEVHQVLLRGGVLIVEGLANLDQLRRDVVNFIALPLHLPGGDGSPTRAVAIEEDA
jgi:arylformamidase